MKKYFAIIVLLSLVAAGCTKKAAQGPASSSANTEVSQSASSTPVAATSTKGFIPKSEPLTLSAYTNPVYGFKLLYLSNFKQFLTADLRTRSAVANTTACDQRAEVCFALKSDPYKTTNLSSAAVSVTILKGMDMQSCATFTQEGGELTATGSQQIHNGAFLTATLKDAGMNQQYESHLYRTWYGKNCYQINATINSVNADVYDPPRQEFDKDDVWQKLEVLAGSFEFTRP